MFVKLQASGYTREGNQHARGWFLVLMQKRSAPIGQTGNNLRAVVRYTRMRQLGHFMMGDAKIGPDEVTLSGSYGSDGLPLSVSDEAWNLGLPLPDELYDAWNHGGGWNSAGAEGPNMRQWALDNLKELRA